MSLNRHAVLHELGVPRPLSQAVLALPAAAVDLGAAAARTPAALRRPLFIQHWVRLPLPLAPWRSALLLVRGVAGWRGRLPVEGLVDEASLAAAPGKGFVQAALRSGDLHAIRGIVLVVGGHQQAAEGEATSAAGASRPSPLGAIPSEVRV